MALKRIFDIVASLFGLLLIWWVFPIVAIMIHLKMPGGPAFFCQKRVGKNAKLFTCHKFRSMAMGHNGSSVSVAGDRRITPFGAKLRHYKIDELPELWDVLTGKMSFVGPRPDVPGYADKLVGDDRCVLMLRPGITGPATLKYRLEDEMIAAFVENFKSIPKEELLKKYADVKILDNEYYLLKKQSKQEIAEWYNDNVIYPDKVKLNKYYYEHYSFCKDIEIIVATIFGLRVWFGGEYV